MRGSSELEYATDNVFVMEAQKDHPTVIDLKHEKNRSGPLTPVALKFHGETYHFTLADIVPNGMTNAKPATGKPINKGAVTNGQVKKPAW